MDILLGVGLSAATVLLFCWAYGAHRAPRRATWVSWPGASMLVVVTMVTMGLVALGFLVKAVFVGRDEFTTMAPIPMVLAAAAVLAAILLSHRLIRPALGRAG